jgi:hypothetical protein
MQEAVLGEASLQGRRIGRQLEVATDQCHFQDYENTGAKDDNFRDGVNDLGLED